MADAPIMSSILGQSKAAMHNKTAIDQSGTKPNLVAKILATNFGIFYVIYVMFSKICSMSVW